MIIIRMSGGLGNQMFQYAFYLKLISLGREVTFDDTTEYQQERAGADAVGNSRPITLPVFGIAYPRCTKEDLIRLTDADMRMTSRIRRHLSGRKSKEMHDEDYVYDASFLSVEEGYFTGCFQSPRYFRGVEDEVRKAFAFPEDILMAGRESGCYGIPAFTKENEQRNLYYQNAIARARRSGHTCAIHLRFGDYLDKSEVYGGIATKAYYQAAIDFLEARIPLLTFFIFSNDVDRAAQWAVSQRYPERFVVVNANDEAHGYADMYLMSLCENYIICNSSFSFWGAWLGQKREEERRTSTGIVIAPSYWINEPDGSELLRTDIFPKEWVRINPSGECLNLLEPDGCTYTSTCAGMKEVQADQAPLVSVIVAAYNIENYISRALSSLQRQTLQNMEFIVVDDGSTDQTGDICDLYAGNDKRFHVIHQSNGGLSRARNAGLTLARGQWIGFLDGDDEALPVMFETMLRAAWMSNADMAVCAYREVDAAITHLAAASVKELARRPEDPGSISMASIRKSDRRNTAGGLPSDQDEVMAAIRKSTVLTREKALDVYVRSGVDDQGTGPLENIHFYNSVWSKLFRRGVVKDLSFPAGRNSEDILYTTKALTGSDKIVYIPEALYLYTANRNNSIMNQRLAERRLQDEIPFYEEQLQWFASLGMETIRQKAAFYFARRLLFYWDDFDKAAHDAGNDGSGTHTEAPLTDAVNAPDNADTPIPQYTAAYAADAIRDRLLSHKNELALLISQADYARKGDKARLKLFLDSPALYRKLRELYERIGRNSDH